MKDIYDFKDKKLLKIILRHPSYQKSIKFQSLEFLGDRILGYEITKLIFDINNSAENLSLKLSDLTNNKLLSQIGGFLSKLVKYHGEWESKIGADCLESFIGAMYLDGGDVSKFIKENWSSQLEQVKNIEQNAKNKVQELSHSLKKNLLYEVIEEDKNFTATVKLMGIKASAMGKSKKEATMEAARNLLKLYKKKK